MKKYLFPIIILFISSAIFAQEQPENPGFEEWENVGFDDQFLEPVNWSSLKTANPEELANVSPSVLERSTDAHSGQYSVHLISKSAFSIVANGILTNGRVFADFNPQDAYIYTDPDNSSWNTPLTGRPDSLVGYYKYISMENDGPEILAVLHIGTTSTPADDTSGWVGKAKAVITFETVSEWTRFSIPFQYYQDVNPEYILFSLSSGNGFLAVEGSELWLDDIELIYNVSGITASSNQPVPDAYGTFGSIIADLTKIRSQSRFDLHIYDVTGKMIKSENLAAGNRYEMTGFKPGVYILGFIDSHGRTTTQKVIVR